MARLKSPFLTLALLLGLSTSLFLSACKEDPDPGNGSDTSKVTEAPIDTAGLPEFSGEGAYAFTEAQVAFGPRNPGSPGAAKALEYLVAELGKYTPDVRKQPFTVDGYNEKLNLNNVIASFNPQATTRILLCAHWDTRPRADFDPDSSQHTQPIVGANDGGSGVGVLLELARIMKENPPSIGVDIVLFDGEDYGDPKIDDVERYFLGAKHFSRNLPEGYRPAFGILLDMVGDKEAVFEQESVSVQYAPEVVSVVWQAARELGIARFVNRPGGAVRDDHVPLNEIARIPTIDIIDASLIGHQDSTNPRRQYWHTHKDTMENISAATLDDVGEVMVYLLYRVIPAQLKAQKPA